jgi:glyoxylase-like metal-dependent hydrolase (beta-lactamase superfamily II)
VGRLARDRGIRAIGMDEIAPGLYRLRGGGFAAIHLAMGDVPTLVDAGAPGRGPALERELRAAGIQIERIVLTHGDPDHAGGSDHLRRAFDAEVCAGTDERAMIDRSAWPQLPRVRRLLMRALYRGVPPPAVDRWLTPADDLGGLTVVPTPGHTPGHICLEWRGWLLAGDAFRSGERFRETSWPFTIDRAEARRSIEALVARALVGASSSHGRPIEGATEKLQALIAKWRQ